MSFMVGSISESLEDYLETIYNLIEKRRFARVKDIADERKVSMASVNSAMKRLSREGLVEHVSRGIILLTNEGEKLAHKIIRRHEFVKEFLVSVLGVPENIAEKDACSFEHSISPETFHRMVTFFEFFTTCGSNFGERFNEYRTQVQDSASIESCRQLGCRHRHHGHRVSPTSLIDLKPGQTGTVSRICASPLIRQRLIDMGVLPNVTITLLRVAPLGDPLEIKLRGYNLSLRKEEAAAILLQDSTQDMTDTKEIA
jgi:DtxR family transcriptional regulator, Mn-dependent transcriptional regulator